MQKTEKMVPCNVKIKNNFQYNYVTGNVINYIIKKQFY